MTIFSPIQGLAKFVSLLHSAERLLHEKMQVFATSIRNETYHATCNIHCSATSANFWSGAATRISHRAKNSPWLPVDCRSLVYPVDSTAWKGEGYPIYSTSDDIITERPTDRQMTTHGYECVCAYRHMPHIRERNKIAFDGSRMFDLWRRRRPNPVIHEEPWKLKNYCVYHFEIIFILLRQFTMKLIHVAYNWFIEKTNILRARSFHFTNALSHGRLSNIGCTNMALYFLTKVSEWICFPNLSIPLFNSSFGGN